MQVVTQHFRPEFINRVDEIVVFHSLGREQIRSIVDIQLGRLRSGWRSAISLCAWTMTHATRSARRASTRCTAPRPLKRAIQSQIENPLAQKILRGDFVAGDHVIAKLKRDALVFEKERLH